MPQIISIGKNRFAPDFHTQINQEYALSRLKEVLRDLSADFRSPRHDAVKHDGEHFYGVLYALVYPKELNPDPKPTHVNIHICPTNTEYLEVKLNQPNKFDVIALKSHQIFLFKQGDLILVNYVRTRVPTEYLNLR